MQPNQYKTKSVKRFLARVFSLIILSSKILLVLAVLAILVYAFAIQYRNAHPIATPAQKVYVDNTATILTTKIEALKDNLVNDLKKCEAPSYKESDGVVTYDPKKGGKNDDKAMSYGLLQFKKSTVIYYSKLLNNQTLTGKEAILLALDDTRSSELAKQIMFNTKGLASGDWTNCEARLSLDSRINLIKSLSSQLAITTTSTSTQVAIIK